MPALRTDFRIKKAPVTIVTCGSVNLDITAFCHRLPKPGETVMGQRYAMSLGGKGANQAAAAARLGAHSAFLGRTGKESFGALVRDRMLDLGIDLNHLGIDAEAPTGVAVINVDQSAENCIVVIGGANLRVDDRDVDAAAALFKKAGVLLLQMEIPWRTSLAASHAMRQAGGTVILDPAPVPEDGLDDGLLRAADIVTPNEIETEALVGIRPTDAASAEAASSRLVERGAQGVIVKMGARGAFFRIGKSMGLVPPFPVKATNSVGAGDAFNGGLAYALGLGHSSDQAVCFAAACGALAATGPGGAASAPTLDAVLDFLASHGVD